MLPYSLLELYKRNLDDLTSHWLLLLLTMQRAHLFLAFLSHFTFQQTPIPNYSALHYSKIPSNSLYTVLYQPTIDVQHHVKKWVGNLILHSFSRKIHDQHIHLYGKSSTA